MEFDQLDSEADQVDGGIKVIGVTSDKEGENQFQSVKSAVNLSVSHRILPCVGTLGHDPARRTREEFSRKKAQKITNERRKADSQKSKLQEWVDCLNRILNGHEYGVLTL